MATRKGQKTPTGTEIDDWFDLLDEESAARGPKAAEPPVEVSRKVTPTADPNADTWDWDMETPVIALPPPAEAHAEEEFTDFGGPTPVTAPIGAASVSSPPKADVSRRFQGTMMFGATPLPPSETPAAATGVPPAPPPIPQAVLSSRAAGPPSLRQRTPVPRAPVSRSIPQVVPLPPQASWVAPQPPMAPSASHPELTAGDLDDLEFEDVSTSRSALPAQGERRTEKATQQRATPVVQVAEFPRSLQTPVVQHSIPPEAKRSPVPGRPPAEARSLMPPSTRREMVDRFELGDFTGALSLAETLLEIDRTDAEAQRIAETSRTKLRAIYVGRLGALDQVPVMMIPHAELRWLALDHRAGFVLSLVDGTSSIEEIIDVSTMPPLEVLRTLYNLLSQNVISLRRPRH